MRSSRTTRVMCAILVHPGPPSNAFCPRNLEARLRRREDTTPIVDANVPGRACSRVVARVREGNSYGHGDG